MDVPGRTMRDLLFFPSSSGNGGSLRRVDSNIHLWWDEWSDSAVCVDHRKSRVPPPHLPHFRIRIRAVGALLDAVLGGLVYGI